LPDPNPLDPMQGELRVIDASLYAIGSSLLFYKLSIRYPDKNINVRALLDCGASYTFISATTMKKFESELPAPRKSSILRVRILDGRIIFTNSSVRLPIGIRT
jgi:hypothetical protein